MTFRELISADDVVCDVEASSKKHALEIVSELLEPLAHIPNEDIFAALCERERLGCTAVGSGVAIPHARIEGLKQTVGVFVRLAEPIEFDTAEQDPVGLIFGFLAPIDASEADAEQLESLTRMLSDVAFVKRLRDAGDCSRLKIALLGMGDARG